MSYRVFLLSPASTAGARARMLLRDGAEFPLAQRVRSSAGAPLGEVFSFLSGLYFRGKLAYARAFARAPAGVSGVHVITSNSGLVDPEQPLTVEALRSAAAVAIDPAEPRYRQPLERTADALAVAAPACCEFVLLGSIATGKYVDLLQAVLADRLRFPAEFVGRGDMSRGGLMLRCVEANRELHYVRLGDTARTGTRPPRLPRKVRA